MILKWFSVLAWFTIACRSEELEEFLRWKQIHYVPPAVGAADFAFPEGPMTTPNGLQQLPEFSYISENNVPMGVNHFKGRLFITMPRRRPGIPATLNYVRLNEHSAGSSPKLTGYPSYGMNQLPSPLHSHNERLVSVYRTRIDDCNRLWFVDTGVLEYPGNATIVQQPSIWVINLLNDRVVKRFEFPADVVQDGRGMASLAVDVDKDRCNEAFAYIPDLNNRALYVYRFEDNGIWTFHHNYFSFDPLWGDLEIAGQKFTWNDGIFSITLGEPQKDGFRNAYFHPMVSTSEFLVSTKVLRNESNADRSYHHNDFKHLGFRGPNKQSTMHDYDKKTGTIFYAEISKYGVGCWNTRKTFSDATHGGVHYDEKRMIYPSDLTVDQDGVLWVMTNSMPLFIYSSLDPNEYNFRVWRQDTRKAIQNTVCDYK